MPLPQREGRGSHGRLKWCLFGPIDVIGLAIMPHAPFIRRADDLINCQSHLGPRCCRLASSLTVFDSGVLFGGSNAGNGPIAHRSSSLSCCDARCLSSQYLPCPENRIELFAYGKILFLELNPQRTGVFLKGTSFAINIPASQRKTMSDRREGASSTEARHPSPKVLTAS
jgi:hypothetical protein